MKNLLSKARLFILILISILCFQFIFSDETEFSLRILGNWKYVSHIYFSVGRYGSKEVDPIKSSLLCFRKDKVYFTDIKFIDTCFYSGLQPKAFFDREDKESHYLLDGPLAIKYSDQKLSKFIRIELDCKSNNFGTFYLNSDTLILDSNGGVTFFFTKKTDDISNKNADKGK